MFLKYLSLPESNSPFYDMFVLLMTSISDYDFCMINTSTNNCIHCTVTVCLVGSHLNYLLIFCGQKSFHNVIKLQAYHFERLWCNRIVNIPSLHHLFLKLLLQCLLRQFSIYLFSVFYL